MTLVPSLLLATGTFSVVFFLSSGLLGPFFFFFFPFVLETPPSATPATALGTSMIIFCVDRTVRVGGLGRLFSSPLLSQAQLFVGEGEIFFPPFSSAQPSPHRNDFWSARPMLHCYVVFVPWIVFQDM